MNSVVIIPAYNEEENIPSVLIDLKKYLPEFDIIVVNDGSMDHTAAVAVSYGAKVISHHVNIGYGAAVQTGFKYASLKAYSTIVLLDADGQHDAADARMLIRTLEEQGADMVIGSRFLGKKQYKFSFARDMGRNIFSRIVYLVTRKNILDISSGFRALNSRAVTFLSRNYPVDFPDAEVIIMMLLSGFKVTEKAAHFRERCIGQSMFSLPKKLYYPFKCFLSIFIVILHIAFKKER